MSLCEYSNSAAIVSVVLLTHQVSGKRLISGLVTASTITGIILCLLTQHVQ